jgi:hypothetical protein
MSMTEFREQDLTGARFERVSLRGATFTQVLLNDASMHAVDFTGARVRGALFNESRMRGVELVDVEISGELQNVVVNGVDIAPLVDAELNRRMPERARMRPDDTDGFREAWAILQRLWEGTVARARTFPEAALHRSVDDEWSFIQTLRHLNFASAAWVGRMILGNASPWHQLDLPWDEAPGWDGIPWDREARPSLDEVLAVRRRTPGDGPPRHGATHRRATRLRGDSHRARLAPGGELPLQGMSPHRPQRGMGTPALCRT